MDTNTLLLIGAGFLGALLALFMLIKIIRGILQIAYLLLVIGASGFVAYYIGTPEGANLLPATIPIDKRLLQAGVVIVLPLILTLLVALFTFIVRQIFSGGSKRKVYKPEDPTPIVQPTVPPQYRQQYQQQYAPPPQHPEYPPPPQYPPQYPPQQPPPAPPTYPPQQEYPAPPTQRTLPPNEPTRQNPTVRKRTDK
jgi:hypothetical protein